MNEMKTTDRKIEVFSILSFSASIIAFVSFFILKYSYLELLFVPGIVFGHISKYIIKKKPLSGGSGIALAGITIGYSIPIIL